MTKTNPRGTSNGNSSGSAYDRRARKAWLLVTFGDGYTAPCFFCAFEVDWHTLTVDRIIPGILGGTYRRDNIRPACGSCNSIDGNKLRMAIRRGEVIRA